MSENLKCITKHPSGFSPCRKSRDICNYNFCTQHMAISARHQLMSVMFC